MATQPEPSLSRITIWVPTILAVIAFGVGYGALKNRVEDNAQDIVRMEQHITNLSNDLVMLQVAKAESIMELRAINAALAHIDTEHADIMQELRATIRVRSPGPGRQ